MDNVTAPQTITDTSNEGTVQQDASQHQETQSQKFVSPFDEAGKARFKVDGQEIEADWDTIQREYQLTKKSRMMMDEAVGVRRKAEEALKNLYAAAKNDPEGVIRTLNPNWSPSQVRQAAAEVQSGEGSGQQGNMDMNAMAKQLREQLMQEFSPIKEKLEQYELERERQALNTEMSDVTEKFPVFKGRVEKQFLMSQYRAALEGETGLSLEEVAFIANRELEDERRTQQESKQQRQQELREKSPVITRQAGGEGKGKPMSIEDVKRLAGRS